MSANNSEAMIPYPLRLFVTKVTLEGHPRATLADARVGMAFAQFVADRPVGLSFKPTERTET